MTADHDPSAVDAMTSASGLPAVRAVLSRARSRWLVNALMRGAAWSLILGLVVFCGFEAAALLADRATISTWIPVLLPQPPLDHLAKGALAFAGAFAFAAIVTFLRVPELAMHARAADRKFALKERLSTALEVASAMPKGAAQSPVRAALLADAERRARSIDVRSLVPLRLPRAAWAAPALMAVAILIAVTPPDWIHLAAPGTSTPHDAIEDDRLSRQQAADAAAKLRRIAEILEQDAAQRSDPYLRTLARTLDHLSADVAAAKIDRPRLTDELSALLAHTQQAYAQSDRSINQSAPRQNAADLLRSALSDLAGNRQAAEVPGHADSVEAGAAEPKPPTRQTQMPERRTNNTQSPPEPSAAAAALRRLGVDISWLLIDEDGNEVDPRSQIERLMAEEERRARRGGQSAGAAAHAGQGDGDQAGDGVHPLGRGNTKSTDLTATEQMLLPDPSGREGSRIRIEIPPDVAQSDVAAPTLDAGGGWRRVPEQPVERPDVGAEGRRIVGRYFKRSADGQGAREPSAREPRAQGRSP